MGSTDTTALVLAVLANAAGVAVAVGMWRRHRRRRRAVRSRHPSIRPPLSVSLVAVPGMSLLRLTVARGAPRLTIDIVSFRPATPSGVWASEPLDEELVMEPGADATLTTPVAEGETAVDVVVAWTAHHPTGDVQGSRLFRIPRERDEPTPPSRVAALAGRPALALVALTCCAAVLAAVSLFSTDGDASDGDAAATTTLVAAAPTTAPTTVAPASTTVPAPATVASMTSPVATTTIEPATTTIEPATTTEQPTVATRPPASRTTPPTTVPSTAVPTTAADLGDPSVEISGRIGECRFSDDCLLASFSIEGFDPRPKEYICEFGDGSRFAFRFDSDSVDDACSTGTSAGEITIEVDGVRSATLARADV